MVLNWYWGYTLKNATEKIKVVHEIDLVILCEDITNSKLYDKLPI